MAKAFTLYFGSWDRKTSLAISSIVDKISTNFSKCINVLMGYTPLVFHTINLWLQKNGDDHYTRKRAV